MAGMQGRRLNVVAMATVIAGAAIGAVFVLDGDVFSAAGTALGIAAPAGSFDKGDPALSPADRQLQAKLQPVIACINRLDGDLESLAGAYRDEVEYARGTLAGKKYMMHMNFNLRFDLNPDPLHPDPINDCAKGLDQAAGMAPPVPDLDAAASEYARTIRAMPPVFAEAKTYYKQEDWKDDRFAKGETLDGQLRPLFASIATTSGALRTAARKQEDALRERQLAAVEAQDGRGARWQGLNVIARVRDVQNEADREAKAGQFSAKAMQLAIEQLGTAWDEANAYASSHPEMMREGVNHTRPMWARIGEPASSYLADAKALRRAVEGGADRDKLRSEYRSMLTSFNQLVDAVNSQY